jgi:hypothetical protein
MRSGRRMAPALSSVVIPGLDPGIYCKLDLRSPGHGLATGPGMTGEVASPSERSEAGITFGPCRSFAPPRLLWASHPSDCEAGLPAHAEAFTRSVDCRELYQRTGTAGHSILHRCFLCIGAQSSSPHENRLPPFRAHLALLVVEQLVLARARAVLHARRNERAFRGELPVRKHQVVQYARIPPGDGVGWPGGSVVEGSDTLRLRPAAVTDRTCRSLRPTAHRFACADVPRAVGRNRSNEGW